MTKRRLAGEALTEACLRLGMRFEGTPAASSSPTGPWRYPVASIEETILAASQVGLDGDYPCLDRLVTWLEVYGRWVRTSALLARLHALEDPRVTVFWSAIALWPRRADEEARWEVLVGFSGGVLIDLPTGVPWGAALPFEEDSLFRQGPLRVLAGFFRHRRDELMSISWSAAQHPALKARIQMGPTYRADMWAALEVDPGLDVHDLSAQVRGPLELARAVRVDWDALHDAHPSGS